MRNNKNEAIVIQFEDTQTLKHNFIQNLLSSARAYKLHDTHMPIHKKLDLGVLSVVPTENQHPLLPSYEVHSSKKPSAEKSKHKAGSSPSRNSNSEYNLTEEKKFSAPNIKSLIENEKTKGALEMLNDSKLKTLNISGVSNSKKDNKLIEIILEENKIIKSEIEKALRENKDLIKKKDDEEKKKIKSEEKYILVSNEEEEAKNISEKNREAILRNEKEIRKLAKKVAILETKQDQLDKNLSELYMCETIVKENHKKYRKIYEALCSNRSIINPEVQSITEIPS